jgi:chromosome segregation ATPase
LKKKQKQKKEAVHSIPKPTTSFNSLKLHMEETHGANTIDTRKKIQKQISDANMQLQSNQSKLVQAAESHPEIAAEIQTLQQELQATSSQTEALMNMNHQQRQSNKKALQNLENLKKELAQQQEERKKLQDQIDQLQLVLCSKPDMPAAMKAKIEEAILKLAGNLTNNVEEARNILLQEQRSKTPSVSSSAVTSVTNSPRVARPSTNVECDKPTPTLSNTSDTPETSQSNSNDKVVNNQNLSESSKEKEIIARILDGQEVPEDELAAVTKGKKLSEVVGFITKFIKFRIPPLTGNDLL